MTTDTWITQHIELLPDSGLMLDLACGKGRHTGLLLQRGFSVIAVDRDTKAISDSEFATHENLEILPYDLEAAPWPFPPGFFDGIVVCNYLHRPLLTALGNSLKDDGVLIYTTFAAGNEAFGKPSNPDYLLRENELSDQFNEGFDILDYFHGETPRPAIRQSIAVRKQPGGNA